MWCAISIELQNVDYYLVISGFSAIVVCGYYSERGTLLKQTCAAQEAQESACQSQHSRSYSFRDLSVHTDRQTCLDRLG